MRKNSKIAMMLATGAVALAFACSVQAAPIFGGVTITGSFVPSNNDLSSPNDSIAISSAFISPGTQNGSFAVLPNSATVSFKSPIVINGAPVTGQLWSINGGQFTFTIVTEFPDGTPTANSATIEGTGLIQSSTAGLDPTLGTWTLGFTETGSVNVQFGFSDVTSAGVPDGGTTAMLLGSVVTGLAVLRRKLAA